MIGATDEEKSFGQCPGDLLTFLTEAYRSGEERSGVEWGRAVGLLQHRIAIHA